MLTLSKDYPILVDGEAKSAIFKRLLYSLKITITLKMPFINIQTSIAEINNENELLKALNYA